jgi:DNA-directed RNA polymerase specialized sigma24 family protein
VEPDGRSDCPQPPAGVVRTIGDGDVDTPSPPRDSQVFDLFYLQRRSKMIGFVRAFTSGKLKDPEAVASEGWRRFYRHWPDCDRPDAYLRRCMISAVQDARREAASQPDTCSLDALAGGEPALDEQSPLPVVDLLDDPWDPDLRAAVDRLDCRFREVVLLDAELPSGQRSDAEIGESLGIHRSTVGRRKKEAYRLLATWLPEDYPQRRSERRFGGCNEGGNSS